MTTKVPDHDLNHEVYLDPKDHKEHINHGMLEYSEEDLKMHNEAFHDHEETSAIWPIHHIKLPPIKPGLKRVLSTAIYYSSYTLHSRASG